MKPEPQQQKQESARRTSEKAPPVPAAGEPIPIRAATTPADTRPLPASNAAGEFDLQGPEYFLNRELTWLNFNFRVLHEAEDERTPLLERVRFIAILGSNLDEFFMKRIGGLKQQVGAGVQDRTVDGRTPEDQIDECYALVRMLESRQRAVLKNIIDELAEHHIVITTYDRLGEAEQQSLREYYVDNVFPLVTPQAIDPAHPFPFISNLSLNLLVSLRYPKEVTPSLARVKVPVGVGVPRFLRLKDRDTFVTLESVMAHNLDLLFPGMEISNCEQFRVTRNANTEREEENADDLLALIETELRDRKFAPVVRVEVAAGMDVLHRQRLAAELSLDEETDVFESVGQLAIRDLMEITTLKKPELHYPPHHPVDHPLMTDAGSVFHIIRESGPLVVHHPYESFQTSVERLLREASRDPSVRAIKIALYRTSADTKVINYLIDAARNGKQVAVVLELKAQFDEEANIRWANSLEETGVHVTYGVVGLKTHCKAILVLRQDADRLRRYAHIGTGNYHAGTARQYADLGLITCDDEIGRDLTELFNYLTTGYKPRRKFIKLLTAPKGLKQALLAKIEREIEQHTASSPGLIQFKLNALEDADVTRALYRASQAGVKVDLIVRDTCRLRPGVAGLSDSITVISIVGRFLEHSRLFYFRNGGAEEYYIGSADCMKRNLESRVELLAPIEHPGLRNYLRYLLDTQLGDQRRAWDMHADGSYEQRRPGKGEQKDSQHLLIEKSERRLKEATRLKRRKPRVVGRSRNVR